MRVASPRLPPLLDNPSARKNSENVLPRENTSALFFFLRFTASVVNQAKKRRGKEP
jgi:hypothetical protein